MNWGRRIQRWLHALFRKRELDARMDDELGLHLQFQTEENIAAGMNPIEARRIALKQFGAVESVRERCRDERGVRMIEDFLQDFRIGARMLRKNIGYTTTAIITLALGIGATTTVVSIVDGVLSRPLDYPRNES